MPYAAQAWVDNVTPVDAAHMLFIENGIEAQVDVDSVVAAAGQLVATKLLAGDANPVFRILGDGLHQWGQGGAGVIDANLYRKQAGQLKTDGAFFVRDAMVVDHGGTGEKIFFGSALDTNLYRYAAGILKTDSNVRMFGGLSVGDGNTGPLYLSPTNSAIYFGVASDAVLYREGAAFLRTDGSFRIVQNILNGGYIQNASQALYSYAFVTGASGDTQNRFTIQNSGHLYWGSGSVAPDTNLYRGAANQLNTDGGFAVGGAINLGAAIYPLNANPGIAWLAAAATGDTQYRFVAAINGTMNWGPGNAPSDTNLYRGAANQLNTDDAFYASSIASNSTLYATSDLFVDGGNTGKKLYFGSALDTNLYRLAASTLRTDGSLSVGLAAQFYGQAVGSGILATLASGDTQLRFQLLNNGSMNWGSGSAATDTNLYRWGAANLQTDGAITSAQTAGAGGAFIASQLASSGYAFLARQAGDTQYRFQLLPDGKIWWGPGGTGGVDTNLYRWPTSPGYLQTDGSLLINKGLWVDYGNTVQKLAFGSAGDTLLWRSAANQLRTDSAFVVGATSGTNLYSMLNAMFASVGIRQFRCGAADSGGAGFRAIVIDN